MVFLVLMIRFLHSRSFKHDPVGDGSRNAAPSAASIETLADLMERLGNVPLNRVRFHPYPGTAIEQDVLTAEDQGLVCELVDGVLVEKAMAYRESVLSVVLGHLLYAFIHPRNLGLVTGEQGTVRLFAGLVRIPDVAFTELGSSSESSHAGRTHSRPGTRPGGRGVEPNNTRGEMERKRHDYFTAGVSLVWLADPITRTVDVYTSETLFTRLTEADVLDGAVLPGFRLPLRDWFAELDRHG